MSKPRICLIIDHPLRDLPGASLIALRLAESGCEVFLVPMFVQERESLALAPDFVLLNYLRKNNESYVHRLKNCGIQYGINDTEGGFYGDLAYYGKVLSQDRDLYESLNCNLIWGRKMLNYLENDFGIRQRLVLTGLPRFDYYSPRLRKAELNLLPDDFKAKPLALINTKVALANPQFVSVEREVELYKNKLGFSDDVIQHFLTYGKLSIDDNVRLAGDLASEFSDINVVIRPHPHERAETYREKLQTAGVTSVKVNRDGPVVPWILAAKSVIHRHCTTAIEAALAGVPAISPAWVNTSANAPDAEAVSHIVESKSELMDLIHAANQGRVQPTPRITAETGRIIDDWLFQVDGDSSARVAGAILESLKSGTRVDRSRCEQRMFDIFENHEGMAGGLYHRLNKLGRFNPKTLWLLENARLKKWKSTQKFFTPQNVVGWIQPITQLEQKRVPNIDWATANDSYLNEYPGLAVKVTF